MLLYRHAPLVGGPVAPPPLLHRAAAASSAAAITAYLPVDRCLERAAVLNRECERERSARTPSAAPFGAGTTNTQ